MIKKDLRVRVGKATDVVEEVIALVTSIFFGKNGKFRYRKEIKDVAKVIKAGLIIGALLVIIPPHLLLQPLSQGVIGRTFKVSTSTGSLITYGLAIIILYFLAKDKLIHAYKYFKKQGKKIFG